MGAGISKSWRKKWSGGLDEKLMFSLIRNERQEGNDCKEMERGGPAIEMVSAWLFGVMVFFANSLNDATDPASRMNYHRSENTRNRGGCEEVLREGHACRMSGNYVCVYSGVVSFLGWIMMRMAAFVVAG